MSNVAVIERKLAAFAHSSLENRSSSGRLRTPFQYQLGNEPECKTFEAETLKSFFSPTSVIAAIHRNPFEYRGVPETEL